MNGFSLEDSGYFDGDLFVFVTRVGEFRLRATYSDGDEGRTCRERSDTGDITWILEEPKHVCKLMCRESADAPPTDHAFLNGRSGSGAKVVWHNLKCRGNGWTSGLYGNIATT